MAETAAQKRQRKLDELEGFPPPPQSAARQASRDAFVARQNSESNVAAQLGFGFGVARDPNDPAVQNSVGQRPVQVDGSLAANSQFPSNDVAGVTTPPPQNQAELATRFQERGGAVQPPPLSAGVPAVPEGEGGSLLRRGLRGIGDAITADFNEFTSDMDAGGRFLGDVGTAIGKFSDAEGPAATGAATKHLIGQIIGPPIKHDLDLAEKEIGDIADFAGGFAFGEPTGTRQVDTQGDGVREAFDRAIENQIDIVEGQAQATGSADAGQESVKTPPRGLKPPPIPATMGVEPIEVIRGTDRSVFFPKEGRDIMGDPTSSQDLRRGLEVPEGFDEATGARVGRLMGGGMSMDEAIAAMDDQDQTAASHVAAGAQVLRAHADAASSHTDDQGMLWITQIGLDGTILMTNTGVSVLQEAKVGQMRDPLGNVTPMLLYPSVQDRNGRQQYGAVPFSELGIDDDDLEGQRRAEERWRELITRFPSHEVIDAMIAEGV